MKKYLISISAAVLSAAIVACSPGAYAAGPSGIIDKVFKQPGAGAVGVAHAVKLAERVSIKDFGASPNASAAVNTAAIQAALTFVRRTGDGYQSASSGRVYAPNGVYKINNTLNIYNGTFFEGESAGGVILEQQDNTKTTLQNVDVATGIDNSLTIKRIAVKYLSQSQSAGTCGIKMASTTAISPVLEDVLAFNANRGFCFALTISLSLNRAYAINSTTDGFAFDDVTGFHNSAANITAAYAAGGGRDGFAGTLIGSTLAAVASDRNSNGYNLRLLSSRLAGSTEACVSFGVLLHDSESSEVQIYSVTSTGAAGGIYLLDSKNIVLTAPKVEWGGGGTGYGLRLGGTSDRITVVAPDIAAYGQGVYSDVAKITFIGGAGISKGLAPGAVPQAVAVGPSGGAGEGGATHTSGFRAALASGYGVSMEAWDEGSPRWGLFAYAGTTATPIFEGSYLSTDVLVSGALVLKSPGGARYRLKVDDAGVLSTTLVVQ